MLFRFDSFQALRGIACSLYMILLKMSSHATPMTVHTAISM